jgi:hypothetical protein
MPEKEEKNFVKSVVSMKKITLFFTFSVNGCRKQTDSEARKGFILQNHKNLNE